MSTQKRSGRRIPRRIQAEFGVGGDKKKRVGFTSNLSVTGMFLGTNSPFEVGALVRVKLLLDEPLELDTIVVHSKKGLAGAVGIIQAGMGLRLLNPDARLSALLGPSSPEGPGALPAPPGDKLSFAEPEAKMKAAAMAPAPSEPSREVESLAVRLAEVEEDRKRLEAMVEADEREKRMLRQLVASLEKTSEGPTQTEEKLKAQKAEAKTRREAAEAEASRLRGRIAELEITLADARKSPPSEPRRVVAGRRSHLTPWTMAIAGAIVGALVVWLVPGLPGTRSEPAVLSTRSNEAAAKPAGADAESALAEPAAAPAPAGRADTSRRDMAGGQAGELPMGDAPGAQSPGEIETSERLTTEETTPLPPPVDPLVAAEETVRRWAAAWSEQRVEEYLSCYATNFEPSGGLTLGEWKDRRRDRLGQPRWIRVGIGPIEATLSSNERATLAFEQSYETPTYSDRVRKALELVREDGSWKIAAEVIQTDESS